MLTADREEHRLHVLLRWRGGWIDERELPLRPPLQAVRTEAATLALIRRLAQWHTDSALAEELNRRGLQTATGLSFTARRVTSLRERYSIPARGKRKDADAPTVSVAVAVGDLGVSRQTLWSRIRTGSLQALRVVRGPSRGLYVLLDTSEQPRLPGLDKAEED